MGFGFNLFLAFIVLPLTGLLILLLLVGFYRKIVAAILTILWGGIIGIVLLSYAIRPFFSKIVLDMDDYYGEYVIDRSFFPGKDADWQYNHFRFEITKEDSIFFHVTDGARIVKTYKGTVRPSMYSSSTRISIRMSEPTHHVVSSNPTTYREVWDFYLVFHSPMYHNMFFRKGEWTK